MKTVIFILSLLFFNKHFSQQFVLFKALRYDEDFSFLKYDTTRNWYKKLKYSPISKNSNTYLSFGGEIRFQYFYAKNEVWGEEPEDNNGYILTRWLAHADLHTGKHFRTFVQLQSSLANSRISPSSVDENPLELHQAFTEFRTGFSKTKFILRAGRQELSYGSQRLVSTRDGPNARQSFDALKAIFQSKNNSFDIFYSHYVAAKNEIFDDGFNGNTRFWGAYFIVNKIPTIKSIDVYYLGLWKRKTRFDDGEGRELRHSLGTRIWNNKSNWLYDIEALYQFGKFPGKNISAWTASINTSYKFNKIKFKPEIGLKTELISGDKEYDDQKLQTFNPLFPRGGYFGLAALIGPANLVDLHPSLSITLCNKLNFDIDYDIFWRHNRNDGIYAVNVSLLYSGRNTEENHIGKQLTGSLIYKTNDFLYFRSEFTWFDAGEYLKIVGAGKDIIFTGITAQLKF